MLTYVCVCDYIYISPLDACSLTWGRVGFTPKCLLFENMLPVKCIPGNIPNVKWILGEVQLFGTRAVQLPKSEIVEEQSDGVGSRRNAGMLTQRTRGRYWLSFWNVPGAELAAQREEGSQGTSREGKMLSAEGSGQVRWPVHLAFKGPSSMYFLEKWWATPFLILRSVQTIKYMLTLVACSCTILIIWML